MRGRFLVRGKYRFSRFFFKVTALLKLWRRGGNDSRSPKSRHVVKQGLDWISKTWTGLVKHGLVKHGLVKHGFVKHGFVKGGFVKHGLTRCFSHG